MSQKLRQSIYTAGALFIGIPFLMISIYRIVNPHLSTVEVFRSSMGYIMAICLGIIFIALAARKP